MVRSALDFDEKTAEEIVTPRVDVTFISIDDSQDKIKDIIIENRYSRIPVYEGTVDHIVGILHTRDYLESLADGKAPQLRDIMQPPYFVFRTQQLSKILSAFKRTKIHLAIVTDEYGGTLGIVTMEDLLEEIVGDINDEYSGRDEVEIVELISGREYMLSGSLKLDDMNEALELNLVSEDYDSLGGYIIEHLEDQIPEIGEYITTDENVRLEVTEVDKNRITKVHAYLPEPEEKEDEKEAAED